MTASSPPSVPLIQLSMQYSGEKLDKSNDEEWCEKVTIALSLNGLYEYVTGDITEPSPAEPLALTNWKANSLLASAFIVSSISRSERPFVDINEAPEVNWMILRNRYRERGPARQVQLLQQALSIQCAKDTPLPETAEKICALIDRAFAIGDMKVDLLCCATLLNSLRDNFPRAHSIISRGIAASTTTSPYGCKDIRPFLEIEQSLLENDQRNDSCSRVALTARAKPNRSRNAPTCGNPVCKKTGHRTEYCIRRGGGMAGKTIDESKAARKSALQQKASGSSISEIPIIADVNERAFTVMFDPETAL